jgi:hypothetical protein
VQKKSLNHLPTRRIRRLLLILLVKEAQAIALWSLDILEFIVE